MPYEGGCGKKFTGEEYSNDMYRCADCNAFFHRDCIRKHFNQPPLEDIMKELEKWKPAVIEMCEKANLDKTQGKQLIGYIYNYIETREKLKVEEVFKAMNAHRCEECEGTGAHSTPSSYDPCSQCDGTGFDLQMGSFNDIKNSILKDLGK